MILCLHWQFRTTTYKVLFLLLLFSSVFLRVWSTAWMSTVHKLHESLWMSDGEGILICMQVNLRPLSTAQRKSVHLRHKERNFYCCLVYSTFQWFGWILCIWRCQLPKTEECENHWYKFEESEGIINSFNNDFASKPNTVLMGLRLDWCISEIPLVNGAFPQRRWHDSPIHFTAVSKYVLWYVVCCLLISQK